MIEQQKLHRLLQVPRKSAQQIIEILKIIKEGSFGMVDAVFEYSQLLLTKYRKEVKAEEPIYLDMYALAALEMETDKKSTVDRAYDRLKGYFSDNRYMKRLQVTKDHINRKQKEEGFVTAKALIVKMVNEDLTDYESRKRDLGLIKYSSSLEEYLARLNNHLESSPSDVEAWQQLAMIYQQYSSYQRAAFCYEQLLLVCPQNDHYYVRLAELLHTQGGLQNLKYAKDYLCYVVTRNDRNYRAVWCLNKVCGKLLEDDSNQTVAELHAATRDRLQQFYKGAKNSKVTLSRFKF